ncbi:hypothetical protein H0R92_10395 [Treponema sp. OMZ 840]|uniref:SPOR domain-containing protein n=1 Tax=Treponema sp. OMZ 840 TaxID=244313 RepID=UPI003D8D4511
MIKKHSIKIISSVLIFFLFMSASKPSLDGRAVVANGGELPPGLYVKTAAFLPGDTVLITNPAAKVSVEALVFGTFSAAEGIAVILSPEAAQRLFITKDSNSIVQITKNGSDMEMSVLSKAFEAVSPAASVQSPVTVQEPVTAETHSDTVPALPEPTIADSTEVAVVEPEITAAVHAADVHSTADSVLEAAENAVENLPAAEETGYVFTPFADTQAAESSAEDSSAVFEEPPVQVAEIPEQTAEPSAEDSTPVIAVSDFENEVPAEIAEHIPAENGEPVAAQEPPAEEPVDTVFVFSDEPIADVSSDVLADATADVAADEPIIEGELAENTDNADLAESVPEVSAVIEEESVSEKTVIEPEIETENAVAAEEPNVLIEAQSNPPAAAEIAVIDSDTADTDEDATAEILPDYFVYTEKPAETEAELTFTEPSKSEKYDYSKIVESVHKDAYLIDGIASLGRGSYCIQLATYKNEANIADVFEKYADKYPLRLIKSEKVPGAYQVIIGPLNKDEYPVILKRFVLWGFKDAFLREVR